MIIQSIFDDFPRLVSIKRVEEFYVIETVMKRGWVIPEHENIKFSKEAKDPYEEYHIFYYDNKTELKIDDVLDWIKYEVIKPNIENEQKEELLNKKIEELKELFQEKSLKELKDLKIKEEKMEEKEMEK